MSGSESALEVVAAEPIGSGRPSPSALRRAIGFLLDAALVVALLATVFLAYGLIGNRWYHIIAIEGGSMEPTITRGDLIVVTPLDSDVKPGMILTMGVDGRIVTHRVIAVLPDGSLVTRGDANDLNDDWHGMPITVFGQYAFTIPALGRFLPVSNTSGASFADQKTADQRIEVGHWTISPPEPGAARPPAATPSPSSSPEPSPAAPTPAAPTPAAPTPAAPTPADPTPAEPTPAEPTPAEPTPGPTESASPAPMATDPPQPTEQDSPTLPPDPAPTP